MNSEELAVWAAILTLLLAKGRSPNELNVLGNLIVAVGSLLLTIAAQEEWIKNAARESHPGDTSPSELQAELAAIRELLHALHAQSQSNSGINE